MSDAEAISTPFEPGGFVGDIYFGHPLKSTMGTHRWTGSEWVALPSVVETLAGLLADARAENARLREACSDLRSIVEGIDGAMKHGTWRDENGTRLKDTPEWVRFYNATTAAAIREAARLLDDIVCGRGIFGVDAAQDLQWATETAGAALALLKTPTGKEVTDPGRNAPPPPRVYNGKSYSPR